MRWEKVEVKPIGKEGDGGPGKRWGHTCNSINGGRHIYVFGGYGKDNCQTNQVHVFDTVNQTWSQPAIKGTPPTPRDSHTCSVVGDRLFVFGGTDGMNPLKDLHILDTSLQTWECPIIRGDGPEAREGHSAAVVGQRLFIFGGCGKSADNNSEVYYNDLYILNTETLVWMRPTTSGTPPSPRDSHTFSAWKNKIIVIGGEDGHDYYLSDVHILDTDAQNLYNDLYMLDTDTGVWTNVTPTTNCPSARFSVAGDCLDPFKGGVLVFIGGCNKSLEALEDMYYLHTGFGESELRPDKLSMKKQLKLKCQEEQNLSPGQNQVMAGYGVGTNIGQAMTALNYSQPNRPNIPANQSISPHGKKTFEAKVTENISEGYTIETVIDGKPLRGILFLNKQNTLHPSAHVINRKRTAGEIDGVISNGAHSNIKTAKVNPMENRHPEPLQHSSEAVVALAASNPITANAAVNHKRLILGSNGEEVAVTESKEESHLLCPYLAFVYTNPEPEAASLNRNAEKNETPTLGGNLKNDGASDATNSRGEAQTNVQTNVLISNLEASRHDKNSDASNWNTQFLKPITAESPMNLSNQGAVVDSTTPRTGESSEPAKQF
ncbi:RING finger protein B-like [Trifolium pratense]|uniref:RING finger protein B-like n=1 Tax=Trifolium pratense TaxID=57577 RepID=A0A2K3P722_TRIPR|nr:RING finger protein B-like [Trifolium pratense]